MSSHHDEDEQQQRQRQQQRPKIVEDGPVMRSVAMMPSMAAPMIPLRSFPSLFHKPPPPPPSSQRQNEASLEPHSLDNNVAPPVVVVAPWKVSKALAIPSYYKMERTHIYVPDASPLAVSERIADCFFKESIAATFDDKQALAKAETNSCVKFAVRLWELNEQVAVEVQRTSGCCFLYQQIAKLILRAAKFGSASPPEATAAARALPLAMPKCVPQLPDSEWEACTADGLEIAVHSLKQVHRWDAHLLAIESLVQLTEKTSKCRAFCAKNILSKDSELLCTILSLIQCSRMKDSEEFNSNSTNTAKEQHLQVMHRHALVILANCLQILELSGDLAAALNDVPELTCDATLQALVSDMSTAASKPHDAAAACRCLHLLCRCCTDSKQRVLQLGAADHVSAALQCRHAILQKECALLMRDL